MAARGETRGVALLALVVMAACAPAHPPGPPDRPQSITEILGGGDATAFARALTPPELRFPEDHGPHDDFRTEWWYFTGNLTDAEGGHRFGYQLTFFRSALTADPAQRSSTWATSQAYMAHFALSDPDGEPAGFHDFERYARAAAGMAGAEASPFRVWLEDWSAVGGSDIPPIRLRAAEEGIAIDLELDAGKPLVLQGDRGLSRKGRAPGNASYYYSLTRLPTDGTVTVGGAVFRVSGLSWMDREWSTSSLDDGLVGWDWFALQFDDGRDLMAYQLRRGDGTADPLSAGTLVANDGIARHLAQADYRIEPLATWRSDETGRSYPSRWRLVVPSERLELEIEPLLLAQELSHSFVYWEGAVSVRGRSGGEPVTGRGYVELTGY